MNETEYILTIIYAAGIGYVSGHLTRNLSHYWQRWGALIGWTFFPVIIMVLLMAAAQISDRDNTIFSVAYLVGFIAGLMKRALPR